jgi:molybdopterin molybdotransferase
MGKEFLRIMDPADVEKIISSLPIKKLVEKVPLEETYHRVLAQDVQATINIPPFRRAAMDGYAVRAEDTFDSREDKPSSLKLNEVVMAGDIPQIEVKEKTCTEVSTGAPVPEGANAVVMVEFTQRKDGIILIHDSVTPGENIAEEGSDIVKGELILPAGTFITPDKIGVLSALGMGEAEVFKKPKVAVISTGNEIITLEEELEYGKLYDINSKTISSAVKSCGCIPIHSKVVKDDYKALNSEIKKFKDVDIIITSGGTSAGAGDVLRLVIDDLGEVLVHGIAVKPGKPTLIGLLQKGNQVIFGLPGYPAAALMVFHVFLAPFLRKAASIEELKMNTLDLKLSRRVRTARGRKHYTLVKIRDDIAEPILKDSGAITALALADGYFEVPKNVEILEKGSYVEVRPLDYF